MVTMTVALPRMSSSLGESEKRDQDPLKKSVHDSVERALPLLSDPHVNISEPYTLAELAMATKEAGDTAHASAIVARLSKLATTERSGVYWALAHNTPFYGWGHAGRVESTAVTILALAAVDPVGSRDLIDAGILWLLHEKKDRYGVWYSGQATIDVLSALLEIGVPAIARADVTFSVRANGRSVPPVTIPPSNMDAPTIVYISDCSSPVTTPSTSKVAADHAPGRPYRHDARRRSRACFPPY